MTDKATFVEKYKPRKFDDLALDDHLKNQLRGLKMQNIIITGYTGTGKSSILKCMAKEVYKKYVNEYVYFLDVIDDRSLKTINEVIENFCKRKINENIRKMIIIDDIDEIPNKIQQIINNVMELYEKKVIFAFTCIDIMNVLEGLQSKCIIIRLGKISDDLIRNQLVKICNSEDIKFTDDSLNAIINISNGDLRKAINNLQMISCYSNNIIYKNVVGILRIPEISIIKYIFKFCKEKDFDNANNTIIGMRRDGLLSFDILNGMILFLKSCDDYMSEEMKIKYLKVISDCAIVISNGLDNELQLSKCIVDMIEIS